ncbi:MAG: type II toxin-antitoxin system RelE/ParE family toxin [Acidobacteriota bacterium]|nr:type II toxin-antitoxin system RelE/ParE family toxin [Acidobacteriota bacterium]
MSGFILHPEAFTDLDDIWEFIAQDNQDAADRVREEIYKIIGALVPFPQKGHRRPDLTTRPLRFTTVRDFLIACAPDEKPLLVIAVIHGSRHPRVMAAILRDREQHI